MKQTKNTTVDPELLSTAYHEAGHAIAAAALGVKVQLVTIVPDPERKTLGHCLPAPLGQGRDDRETDSIILLAGPAVDHLREGTRPDAHWFNRKTHPRRRGLRADDWHKAYWRARQLTEMVCVPAGPQQVSAYLRWLYTRTRDFIVYDPHWRAVEILARRLVSAKTLENRQVREAYRSGRRQSRRRVVRHLRDFDVLPHDDSPFSLDACSKPWRIVIPGGANSRLQPCANNCPRNGTGTGRPRIAREREAGAVAAIRAADRLKLGLASPFDDRG